MVWMVLGINSFFVGGPSSLALSGGVTSWYEVCGSPVVYHWRKLIISKFFGVVTDAPRYPE
jgi:hypothetical protein